MEGKVPNHFAVELNFPELMKSKLGFTKSFGRPVSFLWKRFSTWASLHLERMDANTALVLSARYWFMVLAKISRKQRN